MQVFIDGVYYSKEEAKISVFDHGLLYGDGVFEGIRVYKGRVFKLAEHIERLFRSAAAIRLTIPYDRAALIGLIKEAVLRNNRAEAYIRLLVTRGQGPLGIDPDQCAKPSVIIMVGDISLYPEELYRKGIAVITAATRRLSGDTLDPRIKSLNYLNNIMAKLEAKQAGCLEAVMLNEQGYVCECTADNIFIVKGQMLLTPGTASGALEGVTRGTVIELAVHNKLTVKEANLTRYDLYTCDECFITGSGAEIMPVVSIDGRIIGNGPGRVTGLIVKYFKEYSSNYRDD